MRRLYGECVTILLCRGLGTKQRRNISARFQRIEQTGLPVLSRDEGSDIRLKRGEG